MKRENSCCFTGHRKIPAERLECISADLVEIIKILADNGYKYFICGGALGFDTMAAQAVTALSAVREDIHLILALPCLDQTLKWLYNDEGEESIREYQRLKGLAESIVYLSETHTPDCMKQRNQFMVDNSSFCVAFYSGSARSGSGQTYRMAKKAGLTVFNLYDGSTVAGTL